MTVTAKITSKGQITIPRKIREALDSNTVEIKVDKGRVVLLPVRSVAGALEKYAGKTKVPLAEVREKVWKDVAHEKK